MCKSLFIENDSLYKLIEISDQYKINQLWIFYGNSSFSKKGWIEIAYNINDISEGLISSKNFLSHKDILSIKADVESIGIYDYFVNFVNTYKDEYEFGLINKLKDLFIYKNFDVSDSEINKLILYELENQDYNDLKIVLNVDLEYVDDYIKLFVDNFDNYDFNNIFLLRFIREEFLIEDLTDEEILSLVEDIRKEKEIISFEKEMFGELEKNKDRSFSISQTNKLLSRANIFLDLENIPKSLDYYNVVLKIDPESKIAWNNKGLAFYKIGYYRDAMTCFNNALELDSEYNIAWVNLCILFYDLGKIREAVNCYNMASKVNRSPDSVKVLQKSLKILGKTSDAISIYQDFASQIAIDPSSLIGSVDPSVLIESDPSSLLDTLSSFFEE